MWEGTWRTDDERRTAKDLRLTNYALLPFLLACILFVAMHVVHDGVAVAVTALMWAAACLISGATLGFVFSIPRVAPATPGRGVAAGDESNESRDEQAQLGSGAPVPVHQVNSNLIEISDWLTKITVGLGLVNLKELPIWLDRTASALARGLGSAGCPAETPCTDYAFALGLIVTFSVLGFLMGYLYTRLFLSGAFRRADDSLRLREKVNRILQQEGVVVQGSGALQVTPAQIEAAVRVRDLWFPSKEAGAIAELTRLARKYDTLRLTTIAGATRTGEMTEVVTTMRALALAAYGSLERFSRAASPGERLVAVAMLQVKPDRAYWEWLLARVTLEKPFIGYQALEALRRAVMTASEDEKKELGSMLAVWAKSDRGQTLLTADHDRGRLFRQVPELVQEPPNIQS